MKAKTLRQIGASATGDVPRCGVFAQLLVIGTHAPSVLVLLWRSAWFVGRLRRWLVGGWRRPLLWIAATGSVLWAIERWGSAPSWLSFWSLLALAVILAFAVTVWRARVRMVVEPFLDYTGAVESSGSGGPSVAPAVNTLLVAELAALRDLFVAGDDRTAVQTQAGEARPVETTLQLQDISEFLSDPATSDSKLSFGPLVVPIGTVLAMLGRLARGPRLSGTVQIVRTAEPNGTPSQLATLTAFCSSADGLRSWTVEQVLYDDTGPLFQGSAMRGMVKELATRIFADLALSKAHSWRATQCFLEGLTCYRLASESRRDRGLRLQRAERLFAEALGHDDELPLARYNLGVVYSEMSTDATDRDPAGSERYAIAAENAWRAELERSDSEPDVYYALGNLYYSRGSDGVPRLCDRAVELERSAAGKAKAYDLKGLAERLLDTEFALDRALASRRRSAAYAWLALLRAELVAADPGGTRELASLRISNLAVGLAYEMRANTHDRRRVKRGFRNCRALLRQAARLEDALAPHFELGKIALEFDSRGGGIAVRELQAALRIDPFAGICWACLAAASSKGYQVAIERDHPAEAEGWRAETQRAAQNACNYVPVEQFGDEIAEQLAEALEVIGDQQEAVAVRAFPDFYKELSAVDTGDAANADALEKQLAAVDHPWYRGHIANSLGMLYHGADRPDAALSCFDEAIGSFTAGYPEEIRRSGLRGQRAQSLVALKRWHDALSEALGAAAEDPTNPWERQVLGDVYRDLEDLEHAVEAYDFALLWSPDNVTLHGNLGWCHQRLAQEATEPQRRAEAYRLAIGHLEAMLALSPESKDAPWIHHWLGLAFTATSDYRRAVPHFRVVGKTTESAPVVALYTAQAYTRMKNYARAEATITEALDALRTRINDVNDPLKEDSYIGAEIEDKWPVSDIVVEMCTLLASSYIERDARTEDARSAIRDARGMLDRLKADPDQNALANIHQLEGLIFWKEEQHDAAIEALQLSIDIAPAPETYFDLGGVCMAKIDLARTKRERLQLARRARQACEHARELDVALEWRDRIDATLAALEARPDGIAPGEPTPV